MICHICGNREIRKYKRIKGVDIFECRKCSFGFVDQDKTGTQNIEKTYSYSGYKLQEGKLRNNFNTIIDLIRQHKKKGNILDIGCGYGLLSSMLIEKSGYRLEVIEPSNIPHYLKNIKHIHYKITLERFLKKNKNKYDIILMMDIIEHLKDPSGSMVKLKPMLKEDGIIVIQTPNYQSLMAKMCTHWSWWMIEDHKFFFSPRSVYLLLKKAGFTSEKIMTYENIYDFRKNLDGNFTGLHNRVIRKLIKLIIYGIYFPLYMLFRNMLWKFGYGGLIFNISKPEISS